MRNVLSKIKNITDLEKVIHKPEIKNDLKLLCES